MVVSGALALTAAATANSPLASASSCSCYYQQTSRARARPAVVVAAAVYSSKSSISQLGACCFLSPWTGLLKHLPHTHNRSFHGIKEKKGKFRGKVVYASLFGVGAPEALVIGVVALLVFGPKGLAEVARNLGKTLRAFQPTIRELQDVSREFKSTLEREIGLDEIAPSTNNTYKPTSFSNENQQAMVDPTTFLPISLDALYDGTPKSEAYTSEDLLKVTQEQLAASAAGPQAQGSSPQEQEEGVVGDVPSKVTASNNPESAAQIQSSEKADNDR